MNKFICLAECSWQELPTRTQQWMLHLEHAKILYFEPPAPTVLKRRKVRKISNDFHVYTLPHIFDIEEWYRRGFTRNYKKLANFIQKTAHRHRIDNAILWCTSPWQVHLLQHLSVKGVVYDCFQKWPQYSAQWEEKLAQEADLIFSASDGLTDHLSDFHQNFVPLLNGIDGEIFALDEEVSFSRPTQRTAPVLGYTGHLWPDLDLGPIEQLALKHPDWRIVLMGKDFGNPWMELLREYPNVRFLGCRPPEEVAFYMNRFDVCLNLLRRSDGDKDVLSPRFFEYLTTGNPVVSMIYQDQVEPYPDVVYGAKNSDEFVELCEHALHEVGAWARARRISYGLDSHWDKRAQGMIQILQTIGFYSG